MYFDVDNKYKIMDLSKFGLDYLKNTNYEIHNHNNIFLISTKNMDTMGEIYDCINYCRNQSNKYDLNRVKLFLKKSGLNLTYKKYYMDKNLYNISKKMLKQKFGQYMSKMIIKNLSENEKCLKYLWLYKKEYDALMIISHNVYYILFNIYIKYKQEDFSDCGPLDFESHITLMGDVIRENESIGKFMLEEGVAYNDEENLLNPNITMFGSEHTNIYTNKFEYVGNNNNIIEILDSKLSIGFNGTTIREYGILPLHYKNT